MVSENPVQIVRLDGPPGPSIRGDGLLHFQSVLTRDVLEILEARAGTVRSVFYARKEAERVRISLADQIVLARGQRTDALRQNSATNVALAEARVAACGLELERLALLTADLDEKEVAAVAREAERQRRIAEQTKAARQAAAAFRRAVPAYAAHAAAIAEIVQLGQTAHAATDELRRVGGTELPDLSDATVLVHGRPHALHDVVALPAAPGGSGMLVGRAHSELSPDRRSIYAPPADPAYGRAG